MKSACSWLGRRLAFSASVLTKRTRFYKEASVSLKDDSPNATYYVCLDGKKLKSPAGKIIEIESEPLALAVAQEWNCQGKTLRMDHMRLTGLYFTALDNLHNIQKEQIVSKMLEYLESDTILYRSESNEKLRQLQEEKWGPIVKWANVEHGLKLRPSFAITEVPEISEEGRSHLERFLLGHNSFALTGMQYGVESVKSLLVTLATIARQIEVPNAVELALLEQQFQTKIWGNVEWAHDVEREELISRLAAAVLFVHLSSNIYSRRKF